MEWIKEERGQTEKRCGGGGGGVAAFHGSLPFGVRVYGSGLMDCKRRATMKVDVDETRRTN